MEGRWHLSKGLKAVGGAFPDTWEEAGTVDAKVLRWQWAQDIQGPVRDEFRGQRRQSIRGLSALGDLWLFL